MVPLGLVRVRFSEHRHGAVEAVAAAEVAGDRAGVVGAGVRTGEGGTAHAGAIRDGVLSKRNRVDQILMGYQPAFMARQGEVGVGKGFSA